MLKFHRYFLILQAFIIGLSYRSISLLLLVSGIIGWWYPKSRAAIMRRLTLKTPTGDPVSGMLFSVILFLGWMALSAFWAPPDSDTIKKLVVAFSLLFCSIGAIAFAAYMPQRNIRHVRRYILGGGALGLGVLFIEAISAGAIRQFLPPDGARGDDIVAAGRGLTVALIYLPGVFIWAAPSVMQLGAKYRYKGAIAAAGGYAILGVMALKLDIFANVILIFLVPLAFILGGMWPRIGTRCAGGAIAGILLLSPLVAINLDKIYTPKITGHSSLIEGIDAQTKSAVHRLVIWNFTSQLILDEPIGFLFGEGMHAARYLSEEETLYKQQAESVENLTGYPALPVHPHNLYLEIWLEFGLVGVLVIISFLGYLFIYLDKLLLRLKEEPHIGAAILGLYTMCIFLAGVEISLWRDWRISTISMGIFCIIIFSRSKKNIIHQLRSKEYRPAENIDAK